MIPSTSPVYRINCRDATATQNKDGACRSVSMRWAVCWDVSTVVDVCDRWGSGGG